VNTHRSSETALTSAAARAAHLIVDGEPTIFADTLAAALLGDRADELLAYHRLHGDHPILSAARAHALCRARFTEDVLADATHRGTDQYVILGAGLDTLPYRAAADPDHPAHAVRVFEVDHPATQQAKRAALAAAGIPEPPRTTFVPLDFETDQAGDAGASGLAGTLRRAGLDVARPAVVSWLGVTMYLTSSAIGSTLAAVASLAAGSELVLDYSLPADLRDDTGRTYHDQVGAVAADRGEPWLSSFSPDAMATLLAGHGLGRIRQVGPWEAVPAELWERADGLAPSGPFRLAHAVVVRD
jgi:methyltransferase (TIGR00027 family)